MTAAVPQRPASRRHLATATVLGLVIPAGVFGVPAVFAVMLLAIVLAASVSDRGEHIRRTLLMAMFHPMGILTALMLVLWLPGIFNSPEPMLSLKTWGRELVVVIGAVFLWSILDRNERLQAIAKDTMLLALAGLLTLTLAAIFIYPEIIYALRGTTDPWARYKAISAAFTCVVPILAYIAWTHNSWRRPVAACVGVLILIMVVGTASRASVAGLGAAILVFLVLVSLKSSRLRLPAIGIAIAAVLGTAFYLQSFYNAPPNAGSEVVTTGALGLPFWLVDIHRQIIWDFVLQHVPEAIWFGHGVNAIAHIPGADVAIPGLGQAYVPSHPHNWLLEILSETGVFGLAPMLCIVIGLALNDVLQFWRTGSLRHLTRLLVQVCFWAIAAFGFSIWAPWWGVTFLVLMAILSARPEVPSSPKPKLLFTVTEGFAFLSHRLPMTRAAKTAGFDTGVVCRIGNSYDQIAKHGVTAHPWAIDRAGTNPLREYLTLNRLRNIYEAEEPALVHHVAVKPVLYGAIAACIANVPMVVNAMIGLGFLFINQGQKASILRRIVLFVLRLTLNRPGSVLLVQNPDDADLFANSGVVSPKRIVLIPGSGVDADHYAPIPEPKDGPIIVSVVSRMLWDKGIGETVDAARQLLAEGHNIKVRLIGGCDPANPQNIPEETLNAWHAEGIIEWTGPCTDIKSVWADSHIALLPSYREGMPKALLEAAACARPLITTDAPGCRSLVAHNQNGLLVPVKDAAAIAAAILFLATNPDERQRMGDDARQRIETTYAEDIISRDVEKLYQALHNQPLSPTEAQ